MTQPGGGAPPEARMTEEYGSDEQDKKDELYAARILEAFKKYNQDKQTFLYNQLTRLKKIVFDVAPLLLQAEIPGNRNSGPGHGLVGYEISRRTAQSFSQAFPGKALPRVSGGQDRPVKTLALIG
ncbi:MAG: hypothetical protein AB1896_18015, partial [Thermodesulfobacteriota bacterium]